jgi:anti-repressor protein
MKNKQAVTSSLEVAKTFGKQHKHVLESIDNLVAENSTAKSMFAEGTYENRGKKYRMIYMNRDGFTLLAMGFTGNKAIEFKLKYINAFNQMEQSLKELNQDSYMIKDPILRATKWVEEYKEKQKLIKENKQLQIPALLGTAVSASKDSITVGNFAKVLKQNKIDIGQNRLFKWLRDNKYLIDKGSRHNVPTQKSMDLKIMEVRETVINTRNGDINSFTPLVTGKGQQYFTNLFLKVPAK